MSWRVNTVGADGNAKTVLKEDWTEVLSALKQFRLLGERAWIENSVGEEIDEETGKAKI